MVEAETLTPGQKFLLAALLLAGVGGGLFLVDEGQLEPMAPSKALCPYPLESLDEIEIHNSVTETQIRIAIGSSSDEPNGPMLREPLVDYLEPFILSDFQSVMSGNDWSAAPSTWSAMLSKDLGLAPAATSIRLHFRGGEVFNLRLGARDPAGDWVAAERDSVRVKVGLNAASRLARNSQEWRDKRLVRRPEAVRYLRWAPSEDEGRGFCLKKVGATWEIIEPVRGVLSTSAVGMLNRLLGARADFLPTDALQEPPAAGPSLGGILEISREMNSAAPSQRVEFLGGVAIDRDRTFHPRFPMPSLRLLFMGPEELRSSRLVRMAGQEVLAVRFEASGQTRTFSKNARGWRRHDDETSFSEEGHAFLDTWIRRVAAARETEQAAKPTLEPAGLVFLAKSASFKHAEVLTWWSNGVVGTESGRYSFVDFNIASTAADFLATHARR